ncbi:MAG: hypothetical protein ACW99G_09825 [Candidatus Thorarchaeota archaeon]
MNELEQIIIVLLGITTVFIAISLVLLRRKHSRVTLSQRRMIVGLIVTATVWIVSGGIMAMGILSNPSPEEGLERISFLTNFVFWFLASIYIFVLSWGKKLNKEESQVL